MVGELPPFVGDHAEYTTAFVQGAGHTHLSATPPKGFIVIKRIPTLLFAIVLLALAVAAYYLRDPNQFKQDLQTLAADQTGYKVQINGDIQWRWGLPLGLNAVDIEAKADGETITVGQLTLGISIGSIFTVFDDWKINTLELQDIYWEEPDSIIRISNFNLQNFRAGESTPFAMQLEYTSKNTTSTVITADIAGRFNYGDSGRLRFADTNVSSNIATGTCQGLVSEAQRATGLRQQSQEDLLPVNDLLDYDLNLTCLLTEIPHSPVPLQLVKLVVRNEQGKTQIDLLADNFWGGDASLNSAIDLTAQPLRWTVRTQANNIDSTEFVTWARLKQNWRAKLNINSVVHMRGNSEKALLESISGTTDLDGGSGRMDISSLRDALSAVALISGSDNPVKDWPEEMGYQTLTAQWRVQGSASAIEFTLDNTHAEASGTVDFETRQMDLNGWLRIDEPASQSGLRLPKELMNTKLPMQCLGPLIEPKCRPDKGGVLNLLKQSLTSEKTSALRTRVEEALSDKVPDKLKDTVRGLLGRFGSKED